MNPNPESDYYSWKKDDDWKQRYSKLYSCRNLTLPKVEESHRISFMHDPSPYLTLLARVPNPDLAAASAATSDTFTSTTVVSPRSEEYGSSISQRDDLGGKGTLLLDMVRARQREIAEDILDKALDLPKEDTDEEDTISEACVHGLNMRMTDRSVSRSRVSRMSTRRDMDIPSILAFTANISTPSQPPANAEILTKLARMVNEYPLFLFPGGLSELHGLSSEAVDWLISRYLGSNAANAIRHDDVNAIKCYQVRPLEIPAFQRLNSKSEEGEIPRWSIRRSVCPVCSQKWKDRSSIKNVKNSGLKRNPLQDLPSVIAPARLRTSITLAYVPRPALASVDEEAGLSHGGMKNTSAAWQLTRARRFRIPKRAHPPPEAAEPPTSTAPLVGKDLEKRVSRFLRDEIEPTKRLNPTKVSEAGPAKMSEAGKGTENAPITI